VSRSHSEQLEIGPGGSVLRVIARSPIFVDLDTPLRQVALLMAEESIGVVLVRALHGTAGIVSERDLVAALAAGADPDSERARDVMTADLACVPIDTTVLSVADLMLENEIRHVLVVTEQSTVGVVSMRDILTVLADAARAGKSW
jgi:CBS domain-containing protein